MYVRIINYAVKLMASEGLLSIKPCMRQGHLMLLPSGLHWLIYATFSLIDFRCNFVQITGKFRVIMNITMNENVSLTSVTYIWQRSLLASKSRAENKFCLNWIESYLFYLFIL